MVRASLPRYRYTVDAHDTITGVSPLWLGFARENGAAQLTAEAVIGQDLWRFICGTETIQFYRAILQRVRTTARRIVVPFRCDSPTLRRYMRLDITRGDQGAVQFEGILEHVEPMTRLNLLDPVFPRSHEVLTMCSCCKRVLLEPHGWLNIEDAAARLHLFEQEQAPHVRQAVCFECLVATDVSALPNDPGQSAGRTMV